MIPTPDLIDSLVADAKPVRRLRSPAARASCWLLLAALIVTLVAIGHGVRPDLALKIRQPIFLISVAAAMMTGILAALAAFIASLPDCSRKWLFLPVPALVVWLATVSYGCLVNWVSIGPDGISLGESARCFATLVLVSVPLSLAMLIMLRHVARLSPLPIAITAALAVAAMTATALSILHPLDATVMVLISHIGVVAMFTIPSALYGQRLFEWIAP